MKGTLIALGLALPEGEAEAANGNGPGPEGVRTILEREPLGWDGQTLSDIVAWLGRFPESAWEALRFGFAELGVSPVHGVGVLAGFVALVVLHVLWHREVARRVQQREERYRDKLGDRRARLYATLSIVALSCLLPMVLWGTCRLADWWIIGTNPALAFATGLLRLYLVSALILLGLKEALQHRVLYIRSNEASWLAAGIWTLVVYIVVVRLLILSTRMLGGRSDVLAFLDFLLYGGILLGLGILLLNRRVVLANLPKVQNRLYLQFLKLFHRAYYAAVVFSLILAGFWLFGYTGLARALLLRSWAVVGVFVGILYLDQLAARGIRRMLEGPPEEEAPEGADDLAGISLVIFRYVEIILGIVLVLDLTQLLSPAVDGLATPLFRFGDASISVWLLLQVVAILLGIYLVSRFVEELLEYRVYPRFNLEAGIGKAISTAVKMLLLFAGVMLALETAGIDLTTLTVFAGALGVGIGFGLQSIASNIAGGMTLVFGRIIRRGDIVTVADELGRIQEIGVRATVLRTLDNIEYVIPNEHFVNEKIINWTYTDPLVRVHVPVGVSYGANPEAVRDVLLEVAKDHSQVRSIPRPTVWFRGFGDSSLNFELLVWMDIKKVSQGQLRSDLNFAIFRSLKEAGIEIPFPQRDLHLKSGWQRLAPEDRRGEAPPADEEREAEEERDTEEREPARSDVEDTGEERPFETRKRSSEEESRHIGDDPS